MHGWARPDCRALHEEQTAPPTPVALQHRDGRTPPRADDKRAQLPAGARRVAHAQRLGRSAAHAEAERAGAVARSDHRHDPQLRGRRQLRRLFRGKVPVIHQRDRGRRGRGRSGGRRRRRVRPRLRFPWRRSGSRRWRIGAGRRRGPRTGCRCAADVEVAARGGLTLLPAARGDAALQPAVAVEARAVRCAPAELFQRRDRARAIAVGAAAVADAAVPPLRAAGAAVRVRQPGVADRRDRPRRRPLRQLGEEEQRCNLGHLVLASS